MKVLHINSNYNVSSLYRHFGDHLNLNKCDISMYFPTSKDYKQDNEPNYLVTSPILTKYDRFLFMNRNKKMLRDVENRYDLRRVDILHAHSLFSNGYLAYSLKKKYNIPYVVAVRNTDINLFFKRLIYMRKKGIRILQEAEKIIFLSEPYKRVLLEKYVPSSQRKSIEKKIEIIPNGIDSYWHENRSNKMLNIPKKRLNILSVGVINKNKNALSTAKACKNLIDNFGYEIEFKIIGKIQDQNYFDELKKFRFIKHIPYQKKQQLIKEYRTADIFIMPSIRETFGLVYAEALSQGVPVLYSKGQGFDKQFNEGIVGYSVDSMSITDVENKIIQILKNYEFISSNCTNSIDRYSWDEISKQYINIYKEI